MRRAPYIVIEGPDGAGKTTFASALHDAICRVQHDEGLDVGCVQTREPTHGEWGKRVRDGSGGVAESILDRVSHLNSVVMPALDRGDIVIQDRGWPSMVIYQFADWRPLFWHEVFFRPDIYILLLPKDMAHARRMARRTSSPPPGDGRIQIKRGEAFSTASPAYGGQHCHALGWAYQNLMTPELPDHGANVVIIKDDAREVVNRISNLIVGELDQMRQG